MDFLDLNLCKLWKISSDCVQDDHYLLNNLISEDASKRRIGFMSFSVTRPPIEIKLECKYKINFDHLKVYSVLQSIKSISFQIYIEVFQSKRNVMKKLAEINLLNNHTGFCLKSAISKIEIDDHSLKIVEISRNLQQYLANVQVISIIIRDTQFKRSPVIRKIELFGSPSNSNSIEENEEILKLMTTPDEKKTEEKIISSCNKQPDEFPKEFEIPEEFLDSITHALLTMPFVLPCGVIVDETTIDRYNRSEEMNGRLPCDPFTGVMYKSDSHPMFDASLKMRLDLFKLHHSHEIDVKNSSRTVGKRENPDLCQPSTSQQNHISKKIKLKDSSSSLEDIIQSIYRNGQISSFTSKQQQPQETITKCCRKCNSTDEANILYQISSCSHIFCKECLIQLNFVCFVCGERYENKDVAKINF